MTGAVELTLPCAPSVNRTHRPRPQAIAAKRAWKEEAGWMAAEQKANAVKGRVKIWLKANIRANADLDNLMKPTADLLQDLGIIENDKLIDFWIVQRSDEVERGQMFIVVESLDG